MNEQDLRDCFAMFAMLRIALDGTEEVQEASARRCWRMADAMLQTRSEEVQPETEGGIASVKPKKRYAKKDSV